MKIIDSTIELNPYFVMKEKLNILESSWEQRSQTYQKSHPLKTLSSLPHMPGITKNTKRFLRIKGLWYLIRHDTRRIFLRYFFKRPIRYGLSLLRSYRNPLSFTRDGDLFFYGISSEKTFIEEVSSADSQVILGFSYCHKPFECPSGRFSDKCQNTEDHPVCSQCFIGKCTTLAAHTQAKVLYIPTIHYIGEKLFEMVHSNPNKKTFFLITSCELSLTMFGDWGNMIQSKGIGVRLDGRICNTMKAFHLSEHGIKPGLTTVTKPTEARLINLIKSLPNRTDATYEKV